MNNESICAIVVTYNRKNLLLQCLNALKEQTIPLECIVVINNASTDGTIDFLRDNGWYDDNRFILINLELNQGGAGGFFEGIKFAYEKKFDYLWLMDDDGFPKIDCLEKLYSYRSKNCYIGPIVIDKKYKDKLSFSLRMPNTNIVFDSYSEILSSMKNEEKVIKNAILPFNGTLISRELIEIIGFPKKEFFIWGDEKDYTYRAIKEKANIKIILDAIFYHPTDSSNSTPMFFNKLRFNNTNSKLKLYCFCRNSINIFINHLGVKYALAFFIKVSWFYIFTKPSYHKLLFAWKAMYHGLNNKFTEHIKFIE